MAARIEKGADKAGKRSEEEVRRRGSADGLGCTLVPKVYHTNIAYKGITYFYIMENTYNPVNIYKYKEV